LENKSQEWWQTCERFNKNDKVRSKEWRVSIRFDNPNFWTIIWNMPNPNWTIIKFNPQLIKSTSQFTKITNLFPIQIKNLQIKNIICSFIALHTKIWCLLTIQMKKNQINRQNLFLFKIKKTNKKMKRINLQKI
jgi:hypothetical protein